MAVSVAIYRARIGLFNCRLSNKGNTCSKYTTLANTFSQTLWCAFVLLDCGAGYFILLLLIEMLLVRGGDIKLNPVLLELWANGYQSATQIYGVSCHVL